MGFETGGLKLKPMSTPSFNIITTLFIMLM